MTASSARLFGRGSWAEASRIAAVLRSETVGGALLLVAAAIALVWANSPWGAAYETSATPASARRPCTWT